MKSMMVPNELKLIASILFISFQFDSDWWCFGNACCGDTDLYDEALDIAIDDEEMKTASNDQVLCKNECLEKLQKS